jgi:chromate transporter
VAWVLLLALLFSGLVASSGLIQPALPALGAAMVKVNLLAFGGGYTAIALMYEQVVAAKAWLTPKEFVDGLALGQVTPGPVIMTSTFIGYRVGGPAASALSTFCVFWPSALLLVLLAPEFERVRRIRAVAAAVRGLLAAFVAMLFFVLWQVAEASLTDLATLVIAAAAVVLFRLKVAPGWVVLAAVVLSAFLFRG